MIITHFQMIVLISFEYVKNISLTFFLNTPSNGKVLIASLNTIIATYSVLILKLNKITSKHYENKNVRDKIEF